MSSEAAWLGSSSAGGRDEGWFLFVAESCLELSSTEFHEALFASPLWRPSRRSRFRGACVGLWGGQPQRHGVAGQATVVIAAGASAC